VGRAADRFTPTGRCTGTSSRTSIVYTYELLLDEARISVSLVTVVFEPVGDGTLLRLTEYGAFFDGLEDPTLREQGTGSLLDALERELA
jgi:hypothetical protein